MSRALSRALRGRPLGPPCALRALFAAWPEPLQRLSRAFGRAFGRAFVELHAELRVELCVELCAELYAEPFAELCVVIYAYDD